MNVYIGTSGVLKNAYIGEYHREWNPDASRTLLYLPLESNGNDYSGNNRTTSATNISYGTLGGVSTAYNSAGNGVMRVSPTDIVVGSSEGTVSMLLYYTGGTEYRMAMNFNRYNNYGIGIGTYTDGKFTIWCNGVVDVPNIVTNSWIHISYTVDNSGTVLYVNGTRFSSGAKTTTSVRGTGSNSENGNQALFVSRGGNSNYWEGGIREVIIENKKWSDDDETNYYNFIKAKLGF